MKFSFPYEFDWDSKRNAYSAIAAGILFSLGWWLMIDTAVAYAASWSHWYFTVTVASTLTLFMINSVPNSVIQGNSFEEGICGQRGARLWLMLGFVGAFACLVAGMWIMLGAYVLHEGVGTNWPGVAIFISSLMIFFASLVYKFGRTEELWE